MFQSRGLGLSFKCQTSIVAIISAKDFFTLALFFALTEVLQFGRKRRDFERKFWTWKIFGTTNQMGLTEGGMATPAA